MNLSAIHYFFLFCSSLATGIPIMESAFPPAAEPYLKAAAAVFGLLALVSGAFAPSVSDTQTLKAAAKLGAVRVAGPLAMLLGVVALAWSASACALFTPANLPTTLIDAGKIACIIEHAFVDDATLNSVCNLVTAEERAAAKDIAAAHRAQIGKEMKGMRSDACDGGTEAGK